MSGQALIAFRSFVALAFFLGLGFPALAAAQGRVSEAYGKVPLHFEANRGQTHDGVRFLSRGPGYSLYLTAGEAVLALPGPVALRMSLAGASAEAHVSGLEELAGKANYFIGRDPAKWRTNVPTYAKVEYRGVYPGIDLVYYGNQRQLEYDFIVAPGADPRRIVLDFKGVEKLEIDAQGDLVMHAAGGALRQHKPVIYQDIDGVRRQVAGGYVIKDAHQVAFQVAAYDQARPLVIDPVLSYSTYLGGAGFEDAWTIAVDATGNAYVTGSTNSINFPTTAGARDTTLGGSTDVFVTKLNATGTALVYSTYLGGSATEGGAVGIAVDGLGNAYVTGGTTSSDFPTTPGAFQSALAATGSDAFVTKLNAAGSALAYSTYLGGTGHEGGVFRLAVDTLGNAYVVGHTDSTDFPTTPGAFQTSFAGVGAAYVTKLNAAGSALVYSTYLGESSILIGGVFQELISIAVDTGGNAYVAGGTTSNTFPTTALAFQPLFGGGVRDAFVTKLDVTGSALVYSTYLGGSVDDQAWSIAVDSAGNAYVTGFTGSNDFPVSAAAFDRLLDGNIDAFVAKLNAAGSALVYSTYLGGSLDEGGAGIAVNSLGEAYVTGSTSSLNFPVTAGAPQTGFGGGFTDTFVTKLNAGGSALVYSTYLGGTSNDDALGIALDATGNAYAVGMTSSLNFPTTPGALQTSLDGVADAFVVKLAEAVVVPPPTGTAGKVTGGGTINVTGGIGNFGFNVNRETAGGPIDGHLQYANHAGGAQVRSVTFTTFAITGTTATFGGTCTSNGVPCTFTINVADNGEPGRNDSFEISVDAGPAQGGTLRGGNIQIHKPGRSK